MLQDDNSESFYSMYSHDSAFDAINKKNQKPPSPPVSPIPHIFHKPMPIQQPSTQPNDKRTMKIAQSSINLDDAFQGSVSEERDYQTLGRGQDQYQTNPICGNQGTQRILEEEEHEISGILHREEARGDMSLSLIRQIDCLTVSQVSPNELKQIKSKIELLKKQQQALQSSLTMANQLLINAQSRNKFLQQQIVAYKQKQKPPKFFPEILTKSATPNTQIRNIFQQCNATPPIHKKQGLAQLKNVYRECSFQDSFCIYQNEGYKIQTHYQRNQAGLVLCVKLTPHHHIANKHHFKFGLQLPSSTKFDISRLSYEGSMVLQQYLQWPDNCSHIQMLVHQLDQPQNKHHTHSILIPLPLSHFLQARLQFTPPQQIQQLKNTISKYTLTFNGASKQAIEKIKQMWWIDRFVSTFVAKDMVFIQFCQHETSSQKSDVVNVYGKIGSRLVGGLIQFLSFLVAP